jgi:hypothetical protein
MGKPDTSHTRPVSTASKTIAFRLVPHRPHWIPVSATPTGLTGAGRARLAKLDRPRHEGNKGTGVTPVPY